MTLCPAMPLTIAWNGTVRIVGGGLFFDAGPFGLVPITPNAEQLRINACELSGLDPTATDFSGQRARLLLEFTDIALQEGGP